MRLALPVSMLLLAGVAAAEDIPATAFARPMEFHDAVLSPTGEYIAVQRSADEGKQLVAIVATADMSLLGHIPAGHDFSPFNPVWANDERVIVQMSLDLRREEFQRANGELMAVDFDGDNRQMIIQQPDLVTSGRDYNKPANSLFGFATFAHRLPNEKDHVLIRFFPYEQWRGGRKPVLYKININRGSTKRIAEAPTASASFVFSPDGGLRYSVGLDEEALDDGRNEWVIHRYEDGEWARLDSLDIDASALSILASASDTEIYVQTGHRNKPDRVYRYNLETGDKTAVFAHPTADPAKFDFDRTTGELVAVHFDDGYPNLHLVNEEHIYSQWYPALWEAFGGLRVRIVSSSDDHRLLLLHVTGDTEPGQYRLFDTQTRDMKYLFNAASWIEPDKMSETQPIAFEARDGLQLHGYLTLPRNGDDPAPLVVMPHGGPYGVRDRWKFDSDVQFLASRGYAVLQVNFRGSDGYGWGFGESGYRKWGTDIQYDIIDGTRWAASLDAIDADRICIVGTSFGGYSALMAPTIDPDLYQCAVGVAGVYDLELMWSTGDIEGDQFGDNYLRKAIGRDPDTLRANSPLHNIDKLKIPVLLAHASKDWRVDVKHFKRMVKALEDGDHPHETLLEKREGHGFYDEENRADYLQRLESFLAQHIGE